MTFDIARTYTYGEHYKPAMEMQTEEEATAYFSELIEYMMAKYDQTREEATSIQKQNLGYWAGYYNDETRERVERLFSCKHPMFGAIVDGTPTPEEAFAMGAALAEKQEAE